MRYWVNRMVLLRIGDEGGAEIVAIIYAMHLALSCMVKTGPRVMRILSQNRKFCSCFTMIRCPSSWVL